MKNFLKLASVAAVSFTAGELLMSYRLHRAKSENNTFSTWTWGQSKLVKKMYIDARDLGFAQAMKTNF